MKVIHLLCHSIPFEEDYVFNSWSGRLAKNIKKNSREEIKQECWFAVYNIKKEETWERDGITYRLFPAWTLNRLLESFCGLIISKKLTHALRRVASDPDVIFHIQGERSALLWQFISVIKRRPIFLQFHGYCSPKILVPFERLFITPIEKYYFRYIKRFFVLAEAQRQYLVRKCKISPDKVASSALGVDYEIFKPIEKERARMELGLPADKNIILYVGLFNKTKGVVKIVKAHNEIKATHNTFLVLIGGLRDDKYYDYCVNNADLVVRRLPNEDLVKYFSAADAYAVLCNSRKAKFGGLGIAPIEALACNVPILNSNLADSPKEIKDKIGLLVDSEDSLRKGMIHIINNKNQYSNLHEITRPYFSWQIIIPNLLMIYEKFTKK
jgi:glycosyltransferase involved in cell wall biosynthesis